MEEPDPKAVLYATACSSIKFAKLMWVVTAKAKKEVKAYKTSQIKEKLNHIISILHIQMQMILHNVDWLVLIYI